MRLACAPSLWLVTLADGAVVKVWAASVEGLAGPSDDRDYLFENLMDVDVADQGDFEINVRTLANPERVGVTVAWFPRSAVRQISSG